MVGKTKNISITIPEELIDKIKDSAAGDQRSLSSMIAKIITEYYNQGGK